SRRSESKENYITQDARKIGLIRLGSLFLMLPTRVLTGPQLADGTTLRQPHSMTSSARSNTVCEIVRPSSFAVSRLITSSNLVGCWTGVSAGDAPFSILSICAAFIAWSSRYVVP